MKTLKLSVILLSLIVITHKTAAFAAPSVIDTSTSAEATSPSHQRRPFFDSVHNTHWVFYYNGTAIEYAYSADATNWTTAGTLAYDTTKFSLATKQISG